MPACECLEDKPAPEASQVLVALKFHRINVSLERHLVADVLASCFCLGKTAKPSLRSPRPDTIPVITA